MDLSEYQRLAAATDILGSDDYLMPLLGLSGEVGQLVAEYKKRQRDKTGYVAFEREVREELGDVLWYAAALARHAGLDLSEIARENLSKTRDLYPDPSANSIPSHELFDERMPKTEMFPRRLTFTFVDSVETTGRGEKYNRVRMYQGKDSVGDPLDDNREHMDDYRYHDVIHLAHLAVLGWSPVMRRLMGYKRKSIPAVDRIEDGGRAAAIEEGVAAFVFSVAVEHNLFATATQVPQSLLKTCGKMTAHLEVAKRTNADWQHAILSGYSAFRRVRDNGGGVLDVDLISRTLSFQQVT